jgi:hypothetical protein
VFAELRRLRLLDNRSAWHGSWPEADTRADDARRTAYALDRWNEGRPVLGTIVQRYLATRGIEIRVLPAEARATLRYHARCPHPNGERLPAMLAIIMHAAHGPVALHRTFIRSDGCGKARVDPDKASLGPIAGGAVHFGEPREDRPLVIGEGIETVLSVVLACGLPGWSAISAGGLSKLVLPPVACKVLIVADNDASGTGEHEARKAVMDAGRKKVREIVDNAEELKPEVPDLSVLRLARRAPPALPLDIFGDWWARWLVEAAKGAACPVDYVASNLLAASSAVLGNARWAQAHPKWREPPHLWSGDVGDSGDGKSPGADPFYREILPPIEQRMATGFPDLLRAYQARLEMAKAKHETWLQEVRAAEKRKAAPPLPPEDLDEDEPVAPRLVMSDITIEKVAMTLAGAAPKGLLMHRDELAGFLLGMNSYNDAARQFWLEAYGGRPYRVARVKHPKPILVPRLVVGWHGGIQPARLAQVMREADDGLLARFVWFWPEPIDFDFGTGTPDIEHAIAAFDRLRILEMTKLPDGTLEPVFIPLDSRARELMKAFGREMQQRKKAAGGLLVSTLGKARGLALRLSLNLEYLWWAAGSGNAAPPAEIGERAFAAAAALVADYLIPMAERVFGDAATSEADRNAATLARWIVNMQPRPIEVHVRHLQREVRLVGLSEAAAIHEACEVLVEARWLAPPAPGGGRGQGHRRAAYAVRPELRDVLQ